MTHHTHPVRRCAVLLLTLCGTAATAQIVAPVNQARLSPISDQATAEAKLKPLDLGQTRIDFSTLTPTQRAELVRLLAAPRTDLRLRAWNGIEGGADSESLQIDQTRVQIDPAQSDGIWWFEYVNSGRNARRARWQLSRLPFPQDLNDWRTPPGLVSQGEVPDIKRGEQPNRFKLQIGNFLIGADPSRLDLASAPGQTVTSTLHSLFPADKLYLRVLALGRSSAPVSWPSNMIEIEVRAASANGDTLSALPTLAGTPQLSPPRVAAADQQCHFLVTRDLEIPGPARPGETTPGPDVALKAGQTVNACLPSPKRLLGNFEAFHGSAVYVDTQTKNWDGDRYKAARDRVYEVVLRNFGGVSGGCTSHCRQALGVALDRGAAVLGIPAGTSVPDPVINQAHAYLRYLLLDALRVSDLPAAVHLQASESGINTFRDAMLAPSQATPPPFEPDPAHLDEPGRLNLTLTAGDSESRPIYLQLRETSRNPRLRSALIAVPSIPAGEQISIPVRLFSSDIPAHQETPALASVAQLTADISEPSALLVRVAEQLRAHLKRQAQLARQQSKGQYQIELAWRSATGEVQVIGQLRCSARSGECRMR